MTVISTPGLTSFLNDENCLIFLFSERPFQMVLVLISQTRPKEIIPVNIS